MRRVVLRVTAAALVAAVAAVLPAPGAWAVPVRPDQWHLDALRIPQAHKLATGEGVTVAVVDSGFDPKTPDMKGTVLCGKDFDDPYFPAKCAWKDADDGHGSGVAAFIAAQGGGSNHAYGVAPGVKILPIKIGNSQEDLARGIRYATSHGAGVVNVSQSLTGAIDPRLTSAVKYALGHDVVIVAGAGNLDVHGRTMAHPADIPGIVAATGTGRDGEFWSGSARGPRASVAAPAVHIVGAGAPAQTKTGYIHATGTSVSAAIVSGVVALIRERFPKLDADNVINRLIRTADDKGPKGRDDKYGFGLVDPVEALTAKVPSVSANPLGSPHSAKPSRSRSAAAAPAGSSSAMPVLIAVGIAILVVLAIVLIVVVTRRNRRPPATPSWAARSDRQP